MRINVFDNGLRQGTGHHFDFCLRLARSLTQRGHTVSVWGARGMPADVTDAFRQAGSEPFALFSHCPHAHDLAIGDTPEALSARSHQAAQELALAGPADLSLFPTLTALQLAAWCALEHAGPMAGLVHLPPEDEHPLSGRLWVQAVERVRARSLPVTLAAIDPLVAAALREASDAAPVFDWPMPLDGTVKSHYAPQIRDIGFFGHQRMERGITLVPPLTDALLAAGYRVLIHDTLGQFRPRAAIPNLTLLNGFLRDLGSAMAPCDLVVCTMQSALYTRRTSGIASMAVACGVPLVLPAGCLSAARYQALDSVVCYSEPTVPSVLEAIARCQNGCAARGLAARHAAQAWRENQGMEKFVDALLAAQPARVPAA